MYSQLEEAKREIRQIMAFLNSSYLVRFEKILETRVQLNLDLNAFQEKDYTVKHQNKGDIAQHLRFIIQNDNSFDFYNFVYKTVDKFIEDLRLL